MNKARIEQLLSFITEDPEDPFNRYALAMEYKSTLPEKSIELLKVLVTKNPDYLPAYFHLGELYYSIGNSNKCLPIIEKGIELAVLKNDNLAQRELQNLLSRVKYDE